MPPPSTRSNSPMPTTMRGRSIGCTSVIGMGRSSESTGRRALSSGRTTSSISVLNSPQSGHFPSHLGTRPPQLWQTNSIFVFGMGPQNRE